MPEAFELLDVFGGMLDRAFTPEATKRFHTLASAIAEKVDAGAAIGAFNEANARIAQATLTQAADRPRPVPFASPRQRGVDEDLGELAGVVTVGCHCPNCLN